MSEIEKMYENAGINQVCNTCELRGFKRLCPTKELCVRTNPPFTAEKQLHLIKWLSNKADHIDIHYDRYKGLFNIQTGMGGLYVCNEFEQALASRVNIIWQDLTEEEQQQVKGILE